MPPIKVEERDRSIEAKIERVRKRTQRMAQDDPSKIVAAGIILAILDLLADEL